MCRFLARLGQAQGTACGQTSGRLESFAGLIRCILYWGDFSRNFMHMGITLYGGQINGRLGLFAGLIRFECNYINAFNLVVQ